MRTRDIATGRLGVLGLLGASLALGACTPKVTRDDFNNEVAKLRQEIQQGDQQLSARIDSNSSRLGTLQDSLQAFKQQYNVSLQQMQGRLRFDVPVHFAFAKADIREEDRPLLDRFAAVVKQVYPNALITVEGFTDPAGSTRYNQRLGMQRAESVRDYLGQNGLEGNQLRTVSYGESRVRQVDPGAKGPGDSGLNNRRVAFVIENAAALPDSTTSDSTHGVATTAY